MLKQIQDISKSHKNVKITIENFRKTDGIVFTSEKTSIELDTSVSILLQLTKEIKYYN